MKKACLIGALLIGAASILGVSAQEGITFHRLHSSDFPIITVSYSFDVEYEYLPGADDIELSENGEGEQVWTFEEDHAPALSTVWPTGYTTAEWNDICTYEALNVSGYIVTEGR
jgi:hypothetical protein